jgi:hypothetical protein
MLQPRTRTRSLSPCASSITSRAERRFDAQYTLFAIDTPVAGAHHLHRAAIEGTPISRMVATGSRDPRAVLRARFAQQQPMVGEQPTKEILEQFRSRPQNAALLPANLILRTR